jgi:hypothetical protein
MRSMAEKYIQGILDMRSMAEKYIQGVLSDKIEARDS